MKNSCFSTRNRNFFDWNAYFVTYHPNTDERLFVGIALLGALIVTGVLNLLRSMVVSVAILKFREVDVAEGVGVTKDPVFRLIVYFNSI